MKYLILFCSLFFILSSCSKNDPQIVETIEEVPVEEEETPPDDDIFRFPKLQLLASRNGTFQDKQLFVWNDRYTEFEKTSLTDFYGTSTLRLQYKNRNFYTLINTEEEFFKVRNGAYDLALPIPKSMYYESPDAETFTPQTFSSEKYIYTTYRFLNMGRDEFLQVFHIENQTLSTINTGEIELAEFIFDRAISGDIVVRIGREAMIENYNVYLTHIPTSETLKIEFGPYASTMYNPSTEELWFFKGNLGDYVTEYDIFDTVTFEWTGEGSLTHPILPVKRLSRPTFYSNGFVIQEIQTTGGSIDRFPAFYNENNNTITRFEFTPLHDQIQDEGFIVSEFTSVELDPITGAILVAFKHFNTAGVISGGFAIFDFELELQMTENLQTSIPTDILLME